MISRRELLAAGAALAGGVRFVDAANSPAAAEAASPGPRPTADEASTYNPENVKAWFDQTYFNMVVDYYTEAPERPYGTGFTRDNLLPSLKAARPGFILYYGKGHSGTTAFKSRLGTEHPKVGNDPLKVLREVTREAGVKFCIYYSGLVDGKAGQKHPEWQACGWDGKPYGGGPPFFIIPICPASRYFEDWVVIHLEEIMTRYDPDLIWVDGDWAGGGYCLCERCKKLWRERFGEGAVEKGEYHLWIRNEYRRKFSATVRKYKPTCLYSAGNTTPAADTGLVNHMDWQSGDWFRPDNNRIMQSLAMRHYTTLGLPYDAMTCDTQFIHSFSGARSRHKSMECMLQEGAGVLANGGKWCYWTYPMPDGALIPSRVRQARACHDFAEQRKDLWLGTRSACWTASVDCGARPAWFQGDVDSVLGSAKALLHAHRSPDLIHVNQLRAPIPYELMIVANRAGLKREHAESSKVRRRRRAVANYRCDRTMPGDGGAAGNQDRQPRCPR